MKTCLLFLFILPVLLCQSQTHEQFYDYKSEPTNNVLKARFYSMTEKKDSLWFRYEYYIFEKTPRMKGSYKDSAEKIKHGLFTWYHPNGYLAKTGSYINDKPVGPWVSYFHNGYISDSTFYVFGNKRGTSFSWHYNGFMSDSMITNADGSGVVVQWFDNGMPAAAGKLAAGGKLQGKWQYFHKNGNLSALEVYDNGRLLNKEYFDENGRKEIDTTSKDRELEFPGGLEAWKKYIEKQLYWPANLNFQTDGTAEVVVRWAVDEEGRIVDAYVILPLHPEFDRIALKAIKQSPRWKPAISHNRKVKAYRMQPISFTQTND